MRGLDERIGWLSPWSAAMVVVGGLTALRLAALFTTPLELYPDEAQYWVWSRHLAFGYFSKPPMIAWLIAATTAIGGNSEPWVRIGAPLLHAATALVLARAAARLATARTGFWTATVYSLIPGVQLSSGVIATDAPLLFGVSLALWAYVGLWTASDRRGALWASLAFGAAIGVASLAKYAALYLVLGAALHAATSRRARGLWTPGRLCLAAGSGLAILAPNLVWNAQHHFQTLVHTAANANLTDGSEAARTELGAAGMSAGGARGAPAEHGLVHGLAARLIDPRGAVGFICGQFAVFGPLPFLAALVSAWDVVRRRADERERLLVTIAAPPVLLVLAVAVAARANANWAAAAFPALAMLTAIRLERGWARRWWAPGLGLQAAAAAVFMAAAVWPAMADGLGFANSFKRARGWRASVEAVHVYLDAHASHAAPASALPVSALAVDDRFLFNAVAYYGRDWIDRPGAAPLRMWVHEASAKNQAEAEAPLRRVEGRRVVFASTAFVRAAMWDFGGVSDVEQVRVKLDVRRGRRITLFEGRDFAPRPRDARTGLPLPPPGG